MNLEVKSVSKTYSLGKRRVHALSDVTLTMERSTFCCVSGPSGSGKSTLLNIIGTIDKPDSGTVIVGGKEITVLKPKEILEVRRELIAFVFQDFGLFPFLTAAQNIAYPLTLLKKPKKEIDHAVQSILEKVGLESFGSHKPSELSGGQQQRVGIARALVKGAQFILADEPTANLDSQTAVEIIDLMRDINHTSQVGFLFSTHDQRLIDHADRVFGLRDGKLVP